MVVSAHPLCLSLPLKVLASLDTDGTSRSAGAKTTPFVTVVMDLGGAHPSWFNGGGGQVLRALGRIEGRRARQER